MTSYPLGEESCIGFKEMISNSTRIEKKPKKQTMRHQIFSFLRLLNINAPPFFVKHFFITAIINIVLFHLVWNEVDLRSPAGHDKI